LRSPIGGITVWPSIELVRLARTKNEYVIHIEKILETFESYSIETQISNYCIGEFFIIRRVSTSN